MIRALYSTCFFLITILSYSQSKWDFIKNKDKTTIPFEVVNNMIVIKANLNNTDLNLILDTGSNLNLLFSFPEKDSIAFENTSKIKITGPGMDEPIDAYISKKNTIQIKNLKCKDFDVILLFQEDLQMTTNIGVPIHGIVGADFFKNQIVEIQYLQKKINVFKSDSKKINSIKKGFDVLPIEIKGDKPYLPLEITIDDSHKKSLDLLIDTGLSDGLWIMQNRLDYTFKNSIHDYLGTGLGGEIYGDRVRFSKIKLADYHLEKPIVSFPDSISFVKKNLLIDRNGSLGGAILNRFSIIFDYSNNQMFIKPNANLYEPFKYNMSGISLEHSGYDLIEEKIRVENSNTQSYSLNEYLFEDSMHRFNYILKPGFEISHLRINSAGYNAGLQIGDKIVSINNKKAANYTLSQISEIFESNFDEQITIEIDRKGLKKTVKFILKEEI